MASSAKPQTETEPETSKIKGFSKTKGLRELKISNSLEPKFIDILLKAMYKAHNEGKTVLTLTEFILILKEESLVKEYLNTNNIDISKIVNDIPKSNFNGNNNPDMILLHPDLKKNMLGSYYYGVKHNEPTVSILSFIKYSIKESDSREVNVIKGDLPQLSKLISMLSVNTDEKIVGRENEANVIIRTLFKGDRNNLILIGEEGIGKGYVVKKFMSLISIDPELKEKFSSFSVLKVNFSELITIAQYRPEDFSSIVEEITNTKNKIFYFPNLDLKAISKDGLAIEYIFNSFLKNDSNRVIIGCSYNTYQSTLQKIGVFTKNFEVLTINEPSKEELEIIIKDKMDKLSKDKGISFSDNFVSELIDYTKRFIPTKGFPHKALNLLDELMVSAELHKTNNISGDDIKNVLAQKTGIPIQTLSVSEKDTLMNLDKEMNSVIVGQELAVQSVVQSIQRSRVGLKNPNKPVGSFLFLGPTGVGKTEFAKQLARIYFKDEKAFMRFDMSEYSESHTNQKLIGAPPGYAGYDEGGVLTNYVMQKPYSLLLFDEVEKAHPKTYDLFLQILDDGRLTDSKGHLVDFKNTILIFTSNIGSLDIANESLKPDSVLYSSPKEYFDNNIFPQLTEYLRIELINRFDEVIPFLPLDEKEIYKILLLKIEKIKSNIEAQGYTITFDDNDLVKLAHLSFDPKFGAREIDRVLRKYIENPVASLMLQNEDSKIINWKLNDGEPDQMS